MTGFEKTAAIFKLSSTSAGEPVDGPSQNAGDHGEMYCQER